MGGDQFDQRGLVRRVAAAGKARLGCPAAEFAHRQQPRIDADLLSDPLAADKFIGARPEWQTEVILDSDAHRYRSHPASHFVFESAGMDTERGGELVRINIPRLQLGAEGENFRCSVFAGCAHDLCRFAQASIPVKRFGFWKFEAFGILPRMHWFEDEYLFDRERLGSVLRCVREGLGQTLHDVARASGFSHSNILRTESGKIDLSLEKFVRLSLALDCQPGLLIEAGLLLSLRVLAAEAYNDPSVMALASAGGTDRDLHTANRKQIAMLASGCGLVLNYLAVSADPERTVTSFKFPLNSQPARFAAVAAEFRRMAPDVRMRFPFEMAGRLVTTLREFSLFTDVDITEYLALAAEPSPVIVFPWVPCPFTPFVLEHDFGPPSPNPYAVEHRIRHMRAKLPVLKNLGSCAPQGPPREPGKQTRVNPKVDTSKPHAKVQAMQPPKSWRGLRRRLLKATAQTGARAQLARRLGVARQTVDKWLNQGVEPTANFTLRLLAWVTAREAKQ